MMIEQKGQTRNVIDGDVLYFQHPEHGVLSGPVASVGQHGVTIRHEAGEDGYHRVKWEHVLGHKTRRDRRLKLIDRGEDGGIAEDEDGKRVFIAGELPEEEGGPLNKAQQDEFGPLLIDIGPLHGPSCDCALDAMHKALADEDGLAHDIWAVHENPFIRSLVEKFSERGLTQIAAVRTELEKWLAGSMHVPAVAAPVLPPGFMGRWSSAELDLVRLYLQSIPPGALSLEDWSLVIDYTVQRYLPYSTLNEEAEWLSTKSYLMGKVQAHLGVAEAVVPAALVEALPGSVAEAGVMFKIADVADSVLAYGKARACDAVQAVSDSVRHQLKRVVLEHETQRLAGDPEATTGRLQQKLFEQFDSMNRDWRRIAVTEAGEMANQGVIASLPGGAKVRRIEMYRGACPFCKKIDGRVFSVVAADKPEKNGDTEVWPGKTNVGRSSSPRKRVGNELIERLPSERWWAPAGVVHPHCRGRWEPMASAVTGDDPAFAEWLSKRLGQNKGGVNDQKHNIVSG
jgi:hypothetical protein